ncbi:hypothetical protein BCR37DRAFT_348129 [Protomyces lactucae-debilis]|uniref:RRM domain-containing protein n=1 Tax=Protomyces lactucae-debilis TaxID=2754530 RepID=A0A1Y2FBT3_PROLT|nr:uncharacterized protein BCR37DRAFT_348129 [Protomyces lactucae-debilis]ORY81351.1 hypothetical protein BCR37DRAFT_348129 [Protomyces lactucae-debilis]
MQAAEPKETLYVRNLNEKIHPTLLKTKLQKLFSPYALQQVIAHRNIRMRGQAFCVFDDAAHAERALKDLQGYPFEEKPLVLAYAQSPSDRTVERKEGSEALEKHKEARLARKAARGPLKPNKAAAAALRKAKGSGKAGPGDAGTNPPHKVLFIQNLPEETTVDIMQAVFSRYAGFSEVRMVPGRKGIAFVEYKTDQDAIAAREGTRGLQLSGQQLKVSYGKKT